MQSCLALRFLVKRENGGAREIKHQTEVGMHADVSEDRLPLEKNSARLKITFVGMTYPKVLDRKPPSLSLHFLLAT